MIRAVIIDDWTLAQILTSGELPESWPSSFADTGPQIRATRVELNGNVFFLGPASENDPRLLVIDPRTQSGLFSRLPEKLRAEAFMRLCRVAHVSLAPGRQPIPAKWGPYHSGSRLSFFVTHVVQRRPDRIEVDLNPRGTAHVYAYCLDDQPRQLAEAHIDYGAFDLAMATLDDARLTAMEADSADKSSDESRFHHALVGLAQEERLGLGLSTKQWLERLTREQLAFVDCPLHRSVRLVGSAGTGKTLSLLVKCLVDFEKRGRQPGGFRALFLTFSQTNVNHVLAAIASMDHEGILNRCPNSSLKVSTVQSLAYEGLKLDSYGLAPISLDGIEGRNWQRWILDEAIGTYRKGDWVTRRARCSNWIREGVESPKGSPVAVAFVDSLMNEFACVIEPQGVRKSAEERDGYLRARRKPWMLTLQTRDDRLCALDLYDIFRSSLREQACIGADQLTADYLVELGTNRWDRIREREGFDAVFVDELHLFNRQERMIPHLLMRNPAAAPVVVMAYDFKQSTRASFGAPLETTGPIQLSRDMGLGETDRFELNTAFRYTPEIAHMLEWIDQAIPAAGIAEELGNEWRKVSRASALAAGARPILVVLDGTEAIYNLVFPRAQRRARLLKRGSAVAVLCMSEQLFETYVNAGKYRDTFLAISDREQLSGAYRSRQRFVLSMPEFVAGMQFDSVFLIEANEGEVRDGPDFHGRNLQFVTQMYLGASRAEKKLEIFASKERGGASRCLLHAIEHRALDVISPDDLEDSGAGD